MKPVGNRGYGLRAGLIFGAMLPFVLFLLLSPEPAPEQADDYLPSARARSVAVYIIKSLKSLPGDKAGSVGGDIALASHRREVINLLISLGAELPVHLRPFERLTNQPARSPPSLL